MTGHSVSWVFSSQSANTLATSFRRSRSSRIRASTRRSFVAASSRVARQERRVCRLIKLVISARVNPIAWDTTEVILAPWSAEAKGAPSEGSAAPLASRAIMITTSELTCPNCGHRSTETMPTDACIYFYDCAACGAVLRPKAGDCCVFCSYGSVPCPPVQANPSCCRTQSP
jgi:hypothetical protein